MDSKKLLTDMEGGMVCDDADWMQQAINDLGVPQLLEIVLDNVGNTHSLVRENILGILFELVMDDHLSNEEYLRIFDASLSNMFNGLGSNGDDSVFCRAFSSLGVAHVVYKDGKQECNILSTDQYLLALNKAIEYMGREEDRRGFVLGKGWANAPSHGAYMFEMLIEHPKFPIDYADKILRCIGFHITSQDCFTSKEEASLAKIIPILINLGLDQMAVQTWIKSLLPHITAKPYTDEEHYYDRIIFNIGYFLTALYYALRSKPEYDGLREFISTFEPEMFDLARTEA